MSNDTPKQAQDSTSFYGQLAQKSFMDAIRKQRDEALEKLAVNASANAVLADQLKHTQETVKTLRGLLEENEIELTGLRKKFAQLQATLTPTKVAEPQNTCSASCDGKVGAGQIERRNIDSPNRMREYGTGANSISD